MTTDKMNKANNLSSRIDKIESLRQALIKISKKDKVSSVKINSIEFHVNYTNGAASREVLISGDLSLLVEVNQLLTDTFLNVAIGNLTSQLNELQKQFDAL